MYELHIAMAFNLNIYLVRFEDFRFEYTLHYTCRNRDFRAKYGLQNAINKLFTKFLSEDYGTET